MSTCPVGQRAFSPGAPPRWEGRYHRDDGTRHIRRFLSRRPAVNRSESGPRGRNPANTPVSVARRGRGRTVDTASRRHCGTRSGEGSLQHARSIRSGGHEPADARFCRPGCCRQRRQPSYPQPAPAAVSGTRQPPCAGARTKNRRRRRLPASPRPERDPVRPRNRRSWRPEPERPCERAFSLGAPPRWERRYHRDDGNRHIRRFMSCRPAVNRSDRGREDGTRRIRRFPSLAGEGAEAPC
jgi:hypothetical protein